jgi:dihydrofolate reductase
MMMTADGFVAGPGNELDWVVWEDEMDLDAAELMQSADVMLVGYGAYKDMAAYWPAALTKPGSESEGAFAKLINEKPKVIISQTKEKLLWKNEELLVVTDLTKQVTALKESKGDIVFYGGAGLAQSMVASGVIDEYRLLVSPTAIGKGKALFANISTQLKLQATMAKVYESGAVLLQYRTK